MSLKKEYYFLCGRWLDKSEDDGLIERELVAQEADGVACEPLIRYKVAVTTGILLFYLFIYFYFIILYYFIIILH